MIKCSDVVFGKLKEFTTLATSMQWKYDTLVDLLSTISNLTTDKKRIVVVTQGVKPTIVVQQDKVWYHNAF